MTVLELLRQSLLPSGEPEILLGFLFGENKEYVLTHPEIGLSPATINKFKDLEKKRLAGWSLAAIIGEKEFYGLNFKVSRDVLIPRPETEMIVDEILGLQIESPLVVDVGTGSGAIVIAISKFSKLNNPEYIAVDISKKALEVAVANAKNHSLQAAIHFFRGNLLKPVKERLTDRNLIIAANLPYLTASQIKLSPSIQKEPKLALDGGFAGLKYYRELFTQLQEISYKSLHLYAEIDPSQSEKILALAHRQFPGAKLEIKKDLAGFNRLLMIAK